MITRITLDNYMSHAHTVIEPAAGLTVILGPNNCGKSAIVSALQTLCGDNSGDFMVRHGEKECAVTVETDDGHIIRWRRKAKKSGYVLDGVEVDRTGKGNLPDDLQTLLRLGKVPHPSKPEEFDVHFGEQKSPIFLIDKQADTAAFFSTASDAEKLLEMQKLHKTKAAEKRRQVGETKNELARLDAKLAALSPLDELAGKLETIAIEEKELALLDQEILALEELLALTRRQEQLVEFHRETVAAIATIQTPPALDETDPLESLADQLEHTMGNVVYHMQSAAVLSELTAAPQLTDISPLNAYLEKHAQAQREVSRAAARVQAMDQLNDPPILHETRALEEFSSRLSTATQAVRAAEARQAALAHLEAPPMPIDSSPLNQLLAAVQLATAVKLREKHLLDDVTAELTILEADIAAWLWANPNCPTCGQPTTREHFLSTTHAKQQMIFPAEGETHA